MAQKVNTTKSVKQQPITAASLDAEIKKAGEKLGATKKVKVKIDKVYEKKIGKVHPVGINGAVIYIPVGVEVEVPEPYKAVLEESLATIK